MTSPAGAWAAGDEGLRDELGKALEAATAVYPGPPPLRILRGDLGWVVDALLPVVSAYADRRAAADVELAALIVENATGLGAVTDEQLAEVARGIRDIPRFRARAAALSTPASAVAADEGTGE